MTDHIVGAILTITATIWLAHHAWSRIQHAAETSCRAMYDKARVDFDVAADEAIALTDSDFGMWERREVAS